MKKSVVVLLMFAVVALAAFANGNGEKLSTVEGAATFTPGAQTQSRLMLQTETGEQFAIEMPETELVRLQLQNQERIRVRGVVVDSAPGDATGTQARILARAVIANGKEVKVEEPIQLMERDRDRVRLYTGDQTQDQTRTQSRDGSGSGSGSQKSKTGR